MTPVPRTGTSLQARVLRHVMLSLGFTWLLGSAVMLAVGYFFAEKAFDRSILDDAYLVASGVRVQDGALHLSLTPGEVKAVLFDQEEVMLFAVRDGDGRLIAGSDALGPAEDLERPGSHFTDIEVGGRGFRRATLRIDRPMPFEVAVAQSTRARSDLLGYLLVFSLVPQLVLLAGLLWWLRRSVARDVAPLALLRRLLANRDASDLTPVRVEPATDEVLGLSDDVNALFRRLEESLRAQREFTGNVAHEMRTPLAGIRALAEYGLRHTKPEVWQEQLQSIIAAEARASHALDKLLELALAREARSALRLAPVRLDRAVHDAVLRFLPRADRQGVDLGAEGVETPSVVRADLTLVEGILNNLLENALLHGASRAAGRPVVTVSVRVEPHQTVLAVQDNGPGMSPEETQRMVLRGTQGGTEPGRVGGLGLGLVNLYAQLLQARVSFARTSGEGGWRCELAFPGAPGEAGPPPA